MRRKRCTLCGGKLVNGICQECGLDNRKSDSRYQMENVTPHQEKKTSERESSQTKKEETVKKTDPQRTKSYMTVQAGEKVGKKASGKKGIKIGIVIFIVFLFVNLLQILIDQVQQFAFRESTYLTEHFEEEVDPYADTEAVLNENGAVYERQIVQGEYIVGVHLPEGEYTVELMEGDGGLYVHDSEHQIYVSEYFAEKEGDNREAITECEGVKLFAGAKVEVGVSGLRLRLSSENAQIDEMYGIKNPLTEEVHLEPGVELTAGKDFEPGVYDLYYEGGGENNFGMFRWLVPGTVTDEARKEYDAYTGNVFVQDRLREVGGLQCCNIVLPQDTVICMERTGVRLVPSEMIVSENYSEAYEYIENEEIGSE